MTCARKKQILNVKKQAIYNIANLISNNVKKEHIKKSTLVDVFNRPGVTEAVLQPPP